MFRAIMLATALGSVITIGAPLSAAVAQSGDALAKAERACLDQGVRAHTPAFDVCTNRVSSAFDRGAIDLGYVEARSVRNARDLCTSYGVPANTLGYRECLNSEIDRRAGRTGGTSYSLLADQPHAVVRIDGAGTHYDAQGNVVDRYGYVIHPNPQIASP